MFNKYKIVVGANGGITLVIDLYFVSLYVIFCMISKLIVFIDQLNLDDDEDVQDTIMENANRHVGDSSVLFDTGVLEVDAVVPLWT